MGRGRCAGRVERPRRTRAKTPRLLAGIDAFRLGDRSVRGAVEPAASRPADRGVRAVLESVAEEWRLDLGLGALRCVAGTETPRGATPGFRRQRRTVLSRHL